MTIGIGVLCSTYDDFQDKNGRPRPDAMVFVADTMGSCETDSTPEMHKIYFDEKLPLVACGAGRLDVCGEMFAMFTEQLTASGTVRTHGSVLKTLVTSLNGYLVEKFQLDTLIPNFAWNPTAAPSDLERLKILEAWQSYDFGAEMLLGTFDHAGQALLYSIGRKPDRSGLVHLVSMPGQEVIGTGGYNAALWLNYRQQHLGCSIDRSILHALEAAKFASSAPTVNSEAEVVICTNQCVVFRSKYSDSAEHTEFPFEQLIAQMERYAPPSTKEIKFRRLDPQTLKDQP